VQVSRNRWRGEGAVGRAPKDASFVVIRSKRQEEAL